MKFDKLATYPAKLNLQLSISQTDYTTAQHIKTGATQYRLLNCLQQDCSSETSERGIDNLPP